MYCLKDAEIGDVVQRRAGGRGDGHLLQEPRPRQLRLGLALRRLLGLVQPCVLERHRSLRPDAFDQTALVITELAALAGVVDGKQSDEAIAEVDGNVEGKV